MGSDVDGLLAPGVGGPALPSASRGLSCSRVRSPNDHVNRRELKDPNRIYSKGLPMGPCYGPL